MTEEEYWTIPSKNNSNKDNNKRQEIVKPSKEETIKREGGLLKEGNDIFLFSV